MTFESILSYRLVSTMLINCSEIVTIYNWCVCQLSSHVMKFLKKGITMIVPMMRLYNFYYAHSKKVNEMADVEKRYRSIRSLRSPGNRQRKCMCKKKYKFAPVS